MLLVCSELKTLFRAKRSPRTLPSPVAFSGLSSEDLDDCKPSPTCLVSQELLGHVTPAVRRSGSELHSEQLCVDGLDKGGWNRTETEPEKSTDGPDVDLLEAIKCVSVPLKVYSQFGLSGGTLGPSLHSSRVR